MNFKVFNSLTVIALSLSLLEVPCYPQTIETWPDPGASDEDPLVGSVITGRLSTRYNRPILVNGVSAGSGSTIFTGATLETPSGVGATVVVRSLGQLDIAPETTTIVKFDSGEFRVTLVRGCVILTTGRRRSGFVQTSVGEAGHTDPSDLGFLDVCFLVGAPAPTVNQGAAASAGAGAESHVGAVAAGGAAGVEIEWRVIIAIVAGAGGTITALALAHRGANPSPT